jgi:hypothetical protein
VCTVPTGDGWRKVPIEGGRWWGSGGLGLLCRKRMKVRSCPGSLHRAYVSLPSPLLVLRSNVSLPYV